MNKIIDYLKKPHSYRPTSTGGLNIFKNVVEFYTNNNITPNYPMFLSLFITSNCNSHCLFCSADSRKKQFDGDLANPVLKSKLKELSHNSPPLVISLCGGEPMLYPNRCIEYLEEFKDNDTVFSVLTNLSLDMTEDRLNLIKLLEDHPFSFIQTSIDSMHESEHKKLRAGTDLSKILANIKLLQKRNIKLKVNATISEYNYKNIMDVVRYVYNEGIESLHINHVLPFGRAKNKVNSKLCIDIINSLIEVASSKEFNSIKEHTITFPSETIPFSFIGTKYEDILKLYGNNDGKYLSNQFIYTLSHESTHSGSGWVYNTGVSIEDKTISEAFKLACSSSKKYYYEECKTCLQYNNCNAESFYTGSCLMLDLYNKIDDLLKYRPKATTEESMRLSILNELESKSENIYDVIVCMTNDCNGNCNFCQVNGQHKDTKPKFDVKHVVNFLKENCYNIQLTGGEPLMRMDDLKILITELKKDGHIISLLTNLALIDDSLIETLKSSFTMLDVVQVSIYAHNSDLHNTICGRDDWEKLNNNIIKLLESDVKVRANLTLTNDNVAFVDEIYHFYKSLGINQIAVNGLLKKGRAYDMVDEKYIYNYIYYVHKFIKENDLEGFSLSIPTEVIKTYSNIKNNFGEQICNEDLLINEKNKTIYIHYDGLVYSPNTGEFVCNAADNTLNNIKLKDINRDLSNSECKNCHGFSMCKGNCNLKEIFSKYNNFNYAHCDLL